MPLAGESISASIVIEAPAAEVFGVLVDPTKHAAIDGRQRLDDDADTGWVCDPLYPEPVTASGQVFRMAMYHPNHPNGHYETANLVRVFDPPHAISWKTGYDTGDGRLDFGGWIWRYDLTPLGSCETEVRLSYDWSEVPEYVRQRFPTFPPLSPDHLRNSLNHLAELLAA